MLSLLSSPHSSRVLLQCSSSAACFPLSLHHGVSWLRIRAKWWKSLQVPAVRRIWVVFSMPGEGLEGRRWSTNPQAPREHRGIRHLVWFLYMCLQWKSIWQGMPVTPAVRLDQNNFPAPKPGCFAGTRRALSPRQCSPGCSAGAEHCPGAPVVATLPGSSCCSARTHTAPDSRRPPPVCLPPCFSLPQRAPTYRKHSLNLNAF